MSVNSATILGNLGQDPECKSMPNGNAVANFTVATSEKWKDKQTGEQKELTEWHRIVIYGKLAEVAAQYLKKGSKVYLSGKIKTRKWQNQQGQDQYTTEIVCNEMQMLDSKPQQSTQQGNGGYQQNQNPNNGGFQHQQAPAKHQQQGGYQQAKQGGNANFNDEPPF